MHNGNRLILGSRFLTAEIACLRADRHRQAEIAESDAMGPSFVQAGKKAFGL